MLYRIGEFSRMCRVTIHTLRYYDQQGLLSPARVDRYTGYRYYSGEDLKRMHTLLGLKEAGFSLEEIKALLDGASSPEGLLTAKKAELERSLDAVHRTLLQLESIHLALQEDETMLQVLLKEPRELRAVTVRQMVRGREEIPTIAGEIQRFLTGCGLPSQGGTLVVNYETGYGNEEQDLRIGVIPAGTLPRGCPYEEWRLPAETLASVVAGKAQVEEAYGALCRAAGARRWQIVGPFIEQWYDEDTVEISVPVCQLAPETRQRAGDPHDLPFEDQPELLGRWEMVDQLCCREAFCPGHPKTEGPFGIPEIFFLPGGEPYWIFGWSKGVLLTSMGYPKQNSRNRYTVELIEGQRYLFVEMKLTDFHLHGGRPEIWVLRQADHRAYTKEALRRKDRLDLPFREDPQVLGLWRVCGIAQKPEDFDPDAPRPEENALFWKTVRFDPGGNCRVAYADGSVYERPDYTWTKGAVLCPLSQVAQSYALRRIKGCDYLLIQWKNGDYVYGGREPAYYVFRRYE